LQNRISSLCKNYSINFLTRFFFLAFIATLTAILGYPVFGTTDDNILAGFVDGSYTGKRESKLIFIRPLIGSILYITQGLLPNLGIYSLFLVLILITSFANIGALTSIYSKNDVSRKVIDVFWLLLSIPITTWFTLGPTYTSASMLVTSISLLSLTMLIFSEQRKSLYLNTIFSTILLSIGFLIRPEGGTGVILVTVPVIVLIFLQNRYINFIKLFISLIGFFMIIGVDALVQNQSNSSEWKEYDKWNNLRHQIQHRVSQNYLDDFREKNNWTIPEYHMFMDISFGDEKTFNTKWLQPAFESTSFTRGPKGVINANIEEVFSKVLSIFKTYPYIIFIQFFIFALILYALKTDSFTKIKIAVTIYGPILIALLYMAATLHIPARGVVPILYMPTIMILSISILFDFKSRTKIEFTRIMGFILILISIVSPSGILDTRSKNIENTLAAEISSSELKLFNSKAKYIGPGNAEFYEYRNPYTNMAYWNDPIILTTGNWETFSPHWYKRLNKYGINDRSIYRSLFEENFYWYSYVTPDTSYIVELYLKDEGYSNVNRENLRNLPFGQAIYKFREQ
jgi:hypothetical protein